MPDEACITGSFAYEAETDSWQWSSGLESVLRKLPGGMDRGRDLLPYMSANERLEFEREIERARQERSTFAGLYRLRSGCEKFRLVAVLGAGDEHGVRGQFGDFTEFHLQSVGHETSQQLQKAIAQREVIDQAKGALMLVYGMHERAAFDALKWCSQRSNEKLHVVATRITSAVSHGLDLSPELRSSLDDTLYDLSRGSVGSGMQASPSRLHTRISHAGPHADVTVLSVSGDIDLATVPQFADSLTKLVASTGPNSPVVVDLRAVERFGSAAGPVLLSALRRTLEGGGSLRIVVNPSQTDVDIPHHKGLAMFSSIDAATTP